MKQTTLVTRATAVLGTLLLSLVGTRAATETYNFLGSSPASWVVYAGASAVPNLVTTTPGSIVDAPASSSSYGRLNTAFVGGAWRAGDLFAFHFDGVVSNNTAFRMEFSNGAASGLLGLQFVIVNAGNNADLAQINCLGGTAVTLFDSGNFGGAGGVGLAQRIVGDLSISILSGATTASVSGSLADSLGNLWTGPSTTFNLGASPASIFAGMNVNGGGGVSGINVMNWALTPVPEPSTAMLLAGLGFAGVLFRRHLKAKS